MGTNETVNNKEYPTFASESAVMDEAAVMDLCALLSFYKIRDILR